MKDHEVVSTLLEVQSIIKSKDFENWRTNFVNSNLSVFSYEDENKLIYTEIHKEYEKELERKIANGITSNLSDFMQALPAYLEGPGKNNETAGNAITLLLEASDFIQFRDMMLFTKRQMDDRREAKISGNDSVIDSLSASGQDLSLLNIDVMMDKCANLSLAAESDDWTNVLTNDWMKIDKKPVEVDKRKSKSEIYLKGVWTMNLSVVQCCDMMFSLENRRSKWDSNFKTCEFPFGGSSHDDDVVTSTTIDMGYLVNLVMFGGKPFELITRNVRQWNTPRTGAVTYALLPWKIDTNSVDMNHKLLTIKTGTISPHPVEKNKCVMTTLETNSMGGMPTWALHWMMRATAPSMMKGLESRYLSYVSKNSDFADAHSFYSQKFGQNDWVAEGKLANMKIVDDKESKACYDTKGVESKGWEPRK